MTLEEQQIKVSLTNAIQNWMDAESQTKQWEVGFGEYVGDTTVERMADAAFAVLMSVKNVQKYLKENE